MPKAPPVVPLPDIALCLLEAESPLNEWFPGAMGVGVPANGDRVSFWVMECSGIQALLAQLCKCTEMYTLKDELYGVNYISIELLFFLIFLT